MCAIAGMINLSCDELVIDAMLKTMKRRGPDANGYYIEPQCVLLHSRLSVIDPEKGKQPMLLNWDGKRYCIVYNGELYNTQEIRTQLLQTGHQFHTHSDTEVILRAYAQWGEACLHKFNGIFAFAIWDEIEKKLFLARDRMGVKPLFYKLHENSIIFASEIKTILQYPTVQPQIDKNGIAQIMMLGPGRMPGSGVFKDICELEPGCCGSFSQGKLNWCRYWKLQDAEHTDSFENTADKVRFLVTDAIKRQMVSDVPLGTFLSGGLDSSIISAICSSEYMARGETLPTFSVDYEDNDRYFVSGKFQPDSDNKYIEIMQDAIRSEHHKTVLTADQLMDALQNAVLARDLPGMADVDSSLLLFCNKIRDRVKVGLSGECADEIFGGYPWYRDPKVRSLDGFPWAQNTTLRASLIHNEILSQEDAVQFVGDLYSQTIREADILPNTEPIERRMKEMVNLNQRWFMQTLLDRKDRMSMYNGLEVRVPFCDYRIAEYLYTVPWTYKDYESREKGLLRHAMRGILPEKVLWRRKSPYPKTFDPRYLTLVTERFNEIILNKNEPIFQILNIEALKRIAADESVWPWYGQLMKRPQIIAYMIMLNFWLKEYSISVL